MSDPTPTCDMADKQCGGEVKTYSFDMDLPPVNLCMVHRWKIMQPRRRNQVGEAPVE